MNNKILWLRKEDKTGELRVPVTPEGVRKLNDSGVEVIVEASLNRVFSDDEYKNAGAKITTSNWKNAPREAIILGLKELAEDTTLIYHRQIYFSHTFKGQKGAKTVLERYTKGGGEIYDLEFLTFADGMRVAAFGYWAGYVGTAISLLGFAHYKNSQKLNVPYPKQKTFLNRNELINTVKNEIEKLDLPEINVMVMGALGRCGRGAVDLISDIKYTNITATKWDKSEFDIATKPIAEIISHDVFINCVYLREKIEPMISPQLLTNNQKLKIIGDVSCDPNNPNNPIAVYDEITHIDNPFVQARGSEKYPTYVLAIDHLPTLLPRESSEEFATAILPHLIELMTDDNLPIVWQNAKTCFDKAIKSNGLG